MFQPGLLKGKRILVTGGGTGLGRSMAHRYLELGANVVICGRREDVLKQTAEELTTETGGEIETVGCDVRVPITVPSAMAKAGVLAMTKSLAVEWGPKGIRTCAIVPGPFPTEGAWSRLMPKERGGNEELIKTVPLRRVGKHEELANLAAFLVSDGAAYINGDAIVIDGGKMLQSGGGGANTQAMIDWTDEQWEAIRPKRK